MRSCSFVDCAGKPRSVHMHVPEHVHVLFLSAYSPKLQPNEHLWALTNTVVADIHFAAIDAFSSRLT